MLIYDGQCAFCRRELGRLQKISGGSLAAESFRDPGVPQKHGLTMAQCDEEIHLVTVGKVYAGAEAVARVLMGHRWFRLIAWGYYLPGVRAASDAAYRWVARRRACYTAAGMVTGIGGAFSPAAWEEKKP